MRRYEYTPLARVIALVMSLAILHPRAGFAQVNIESPGLSAGGTVTGPILFPDGTAGAPSVAWASDADGTGTGFYRSNANTIGFSVNGTLTAQLSAGTFSWPAAMVIGWHAGAVTGTPDLTLVRDAAATLQMGADANGAVVNQTFKACDGITGADIAGCKMTVAGGRATGAGAPGDFVIQTAKDLGTGTTAQTLFDRHYYRGMAKALTESSATTFVSINVPTTLTGAGGTINYCIYAADASDVQERCGEEDFAAANKGGTMTCSTPNILGTEATVFTAGAGTLTNTFTFVANGTACDMKANAASSLTQTTLDIRYNIEMHGSGTVTP